MNYGENGELTNLFQAVQHAAKAEVFDMPDGSRVLVQGGKQIVHVEKPEKEKRVEQVAVSTLEALKEYVEKLYVNLADDEHTFVLKVESVSLVHLLDVHDDKNRVLHVSASAGSSANCSMIQSFVEIEQALIQLRECFVADDMVDRLVDEFSTIKIEDLTELSDGGLSREITVRSRISSKNSKSGDATIDKVVLYPVRTFPEVAIHPSTFMIRIKRNGNNASIRLVEQHYRNWEYQQKKMVAEHLKTLLPEATILV